MVFRRTQALSPQQTPRRNPFLKTKWYQYFMRLKVQHMCILKMSGKTKIKATHCPTKMKDNKTKALRWGWKSMGLRLASWPYICHVHLLVWELREGAAGLFPQARATEPRLACSPCERRHSTAAAHSTRKRSGNDGCRPAHSSCSTPLSHVLCVIS